MSKALTLSQVTGKRKRPHGVWVGVAVVVGTGVVVVTALQEGLSHLPSNEGACDKGAAQNKQQHLLRPPGVVVSTGFVVRTALQTRPSVTFPPTDWKACG